MTLRKDLVEIAKLIQPGSRVLELGCGYGELLAYLLKEKQVDARGIEIEQAGVSHCVNQGLAVIQGDVENDLQHYPNYCFDYVISSQVLQATHRPKKVLQDILRIGRYCVVSIPNFGYWPNRLYLAMKGRMPVTRALSYEWYETPNIHFCTVKDFDILCAQMGVQIQKKVLLNDEDDQSLPARYLCENIFAAKVIYVLTRTEYSI